MAIAVRSVTVGTDTGASATVAATTPTTTQVGDLLVVGYSNDFYTLAAMGTPTCTGSPTLTAVTSGTADGGSGEGHIKTYTAVANTAGANTVTVTETGTHDEEKAMVIYVLTGADTTTPVDAAANLVGTPINDNQNAPSASPATSDALLICFNNSGPSGNSAYGTPAPMTEQYEIHVGGMSGVGATEQLAASGATGVRTFTCVPGNNILWVAVSIAIRTAAGGGAAPAQMQPFVLPGLAAIQAASW